MDERDCGETVKQLEWSRVRFLRMATQTNYIAFEKGIRALYPAQNNQNTQQESPNIEALFSEFKPEARNQVIVDAIDRIISNKENTLQINKGDLVYRARRLDKAENILKLETSADGVLGLNSQESGAPPSDDNIPIRAGRANKPNESVFYAALEKYTAIAEMEPYWRLLINIATYETLKPLNLLNMIYEGRCRPNNPNDKAWKTQLEIEEICFAFSIPVEGYDENIRYLPTQYIAHKARVKGFDGIAYNSVKNIGGRNVVLFDDNSVKYQKSETVRCNGIEYSISNISHPCEEAPHMERIINVQSCNALREESKNLKQIVERERSRT